MRFPPPSFWTCALCGLLGAFAGKGTPSPQAAEEPVSPSSFTPPSWMTSLPLPKPPPFTSAIASMDWVRSQMEKGDTTAAERLFWKDTGLTDEQCLDLAKVLANNFRSMDPRMLARIILGLPRGEASDRLLWRFLGYWSSSDADDALRFMEALPADRLNTCGLLQNAAGFAIARLPAERALAFTARLDEKGRAYIAEALVGCADQIGSWRNTSAILDKLDDRVKPHKGFVSAEWKLGVQLAEIDPQAIENQIAAETDQAKRDDMLGGYAWITGMNDAPRGLELDAQIQDQGVREEHALNHVQNWLVSDRAAALAWLRSDGARQLMNPEERTELLNLYPKEAAP